MSFYLVRLDPDGEKALPDYGPYDQGPEAAKQAKTLSDQLGVKVQPRRMRQAPDWKARQQRRIETGELTPLPPEWDLVPIQDHFAHLSKKNPRLIAFTESEEKGIIDRVTAVKPGGYLIRFYPQLDENERKRYAAYIDKGDGLQFAWTEDEIEWVYESGTIREEEDDNGVCSSCMTRKYQKGQYASDFLSPIHPVRVYAAGDLAIAYRCGKSGNVAERGLVWPEKKIYGRIYSDGSHRLKKLLDEEGFKPFRTQDLNGARLKRVLFQMSGNDHFVIPHVDAGPVPGSGAALVRDGGDFLIIDSVNGTMCGGTRGATPAVFAEVMRRAA